MPPAPPRVRPLQAADKADWDRLWAGYLAFYGFEQPAALNDLSFRRLLDPAEGRMAGWLSLDPAGRPAGLVHALLHRSTSSPSWYCYLEDLYVDPAARGGGHGRALIETVYRWAETAGATKVYWATQEDNATARRLYDRLARKTEFVQYDWRPET